ncbi:ATP-dependent RNA helicase DDX51 [Osmerus mordax]|uniref:ATP-dependent RNA helicase DDX51 n=1 Tax=Osmerus mordax TaxID=8014 RepID=UPI003510C434
MALFLINRYLGEDDDEETNKESRSQDLLAKLQKKAKEKQKLACHNAHVQAEIDSKSKVDHPKETKRAKKREGEGNQVLPHAPDAVEHGGSPDDNKPRKKKKKGSEKTKLKSDGKSEEVKMAKPDHELVAVEEPEDEDGGEQSIVTKTQTDPSEQNTENGVAPTGFTILGGHEQKRIQKVHRILPQWLSKPDAIQRDIKSNLVPISDVPRMSPKIMKKLESNGIQNLFPVQAEVIPAILESVCHGFLIGRGGYRPRDICVSAPTGSGKTLTFVLPVIQALMQRVVCEVRALVVLPTKELAQQVCKVFTSYAEGTTLKVVILAGQKSFGAEQASLSENRGGYSCCLADIVVATPGRLVDHINLNAGFSLEHLRFLVIDEADRMIDSMHQSWLSQVTKAVYKCRSGPDAIFRRTEPTHITAASLSPPQMPLQKLLFSATLTQNPEKLQQLGLYQPRLFSSIPSQLASENPSSDTDVSQPNETFNFPEGLTEYYVPCTLNKKPLLLLHFLLRLKFSPILCFTNSRDAAHRLYVLVKLFGGVQVAEFSSRLSPNERKKTLKDFDQGKIQLLISTDAAARGIDVDGVKCVLNYDAPQFIRAYIHRIGRTARAGKAGLAFTFLLGVQEKNFLKMVSDAGSPGIQKQIIMPNNLKNMECRYQEILQELGKTIKSENAKKRV